ncbi:MAG: imidazole glycerol phosphate synthase subunit HisH [Longibaculum muris]|uniref:Imidazole glycerol phosphate synthase subunit HisH n=1 Tax=Longibaculum muris TaxID=1796628 RepID=A0A4R3Z674_9FIRM|nr:imidazole glycerol phosphate synthase subunit HisH [Longibaculum muris]MBS5367960.1 imidazole glycerol phosphate synthase subunit HisH [Coprobacillus cateniformis]MCR1887159.1 imidazole glycerol phosphate synthase subunit HisH [Longibaculum muris]MED9811951.1 imidazole glycerol phosphate synthase subunit HisH [Longibaculum muris]TCW02269.1 glutamine amidotransferase [Longibaculum muris]
MVVIIDYNIGNLKSVQNAFERIGVKTIVSRDHDVISQADGIVLPGVGTFPVAMENLKKYDLIDILKERKAAGVPILGICLGMQILFEQGQEVKLTKGLGFLKGEVKLMQVNAKIPHMGWNELCFAKKHPLLKNIKEKDYVYFVHSYMAYPCEKELVAYCEYGDSKITAIVAKDNVMGCQFHPEKSGEVGKQILLAFKEMIQ